MARVGMVEIDPSTGAGIEAYRAAKGVERDVQIINALRKHDLLPGDKALNNRLQRIVEVDLAYKRLYEAHREAKETINDRELQQEVAQKTMLGFVDHVKDGGDPGEFDFVQFGPDLPDIEGLRVRRNIAQGARVGAIREFFSELKQYGYDQWYEKQLQPLLDKQINYTVDDTWQYATVKRKRREAERLEPELRRVNLAVAKKTLLDGVHPQKPGIEKTLLEDIWNASEALAEHTYDEDRFEKRQGVPMHKLRLSEVPGSQDS